jgi:TfoX/Sxy family transcriptional regulator of competence genes
VSYFELPADILEDADECAVWAAKSVAAANDRTKPVRKAKSRRQ